MMAKTIVWRLTAELSTHVSESSRLEHEICNNRKGLGYAW
jgi:hypothetical protein